MFNLKSLLVSAFLFNFFVQAEVVSEQLEICIGKGNWQKIKTCEFQITTEVYNKWIRFSNFGTNVNVPVTSHDENKDLGIVEYNCQPTSYSKVNSNNYKATFTCNASEMIEPFAGTTAIDIWRPCTSFSVEGIIMTGWVESGYFWKKKTGCRNGNENWKKFQYIKNY